MAEATNINKITENTKQQNSNTKMTNERARTDAIKGLHHKMHVGKHKTNTMQGKITDNETTTIATKLY